MLCPLRREAGSANRLAQRNRRRRGTRGGPRRIQRPQSKPPQRRQSAWFRRLQVAAWRRWEPQGQPPQRRPSARFRRLQVAAWRRWEQDSSPARAGPRPLRSLGCRWRRPCHDRRTRAVDRQERERTLASEVHGGLGSVAVRQTLVICSPNASRIRGICSTASVPTPPPRCRGSEIFLRRGSS